MNTDHPTDLTDLDGLGRKFEARLYEAGVRTLEDLAEKDPGRLLEQLGVVPGLSVEKVQRWIDAAREAAGDSARVVAASVENQPKEQFESTAVSAQHVEVMLTGGYIIGGGPRDMEVVFNPESLEGYGFERFSYVATGIARRLGTTSWTRLGGCDGAGLTSELVPMRFQSVRVSPGVYRVQMRVQVSPPARSRLPSPVVAGANYRPT